MRTPARPRLPDGDCVFISDARIVARADAPFIAADMTWLGLTPLQSEISRRQASTAIIRRMAYSLAKPRGAADRASSDGRLPLPLEGPGGCCHRGRSPLRTTDRKLPGPEATAR